MKTDEIFDNLEIQFQKLRPSKPVPEELKEEVFETLEKINAVSQIKSFMQQVEAEEAGTNIKRIVQRSKQNKFPSSE